MKACKICRKTERDPEKCFERHKRRKDMYWFNYIEEKAIRDSLEDEWNHPSQTTLNRY